MLMSTSNFELEQVRHNLIVIPVTQIEKHPKFIVTLFTLNATIKFQLASNAGVFGVHELMFRVSVPS